MHKNLVRGGKTLVNTVLAAHCTTRKSTRSSRAIRAALAILSAALLFVCGFFGGLSRLPLVGGMLTPLTAHAVTRTFTIEQDNNANLLIYEGANWMETMAPGNSNYLSLGSAPYNCKRGDAVEIVVKGNVSLTGIDSVSGINITLKPDGSSDSLWLEHIDYDTVGSGDTMTVEPGLLLEISSNSSTPIEGNLVNNGTLKTYALSVVAPGSLTNNGTMTNEGQLYISTGVTFTNNGRVYNNGIVDNNGTVNNSGTLTNNGNFNNNGTINNSGTITGITGGIINQISPVPAAPASSCATGHASYTWQTVTSADAHNDGEMVFACAGCGHVLYRVPLSAYGPFQKVTAEKIRNAAPGATVEITTSRWISFHRSVMEALAARPDVTLTISFLDGEYRGNRRIVTIPAGYDTLSLLNGTDYCGFLYLGSKFGLH